VLAKAAQISSHKAMSRFSIRLDRITRVLQVFLTGSLALSLHRHQWFNALLITILLLTTVLPTLLKRWVEIRIPPELHAVALLFVFAAIFLGEMRSYYLKFWWWDLALHTTSGFLLGIVGFLLVYILNESRSIEFRMKQGFVAFFSFAFALAAGSVWEVFEFGMDRLFGLNMQKSGLIDTMTDLILNTIGALTMSILGYFYMKRGLSSIFARMLTSVIEANPRIFRRRATSADSPKRPP